VANSNRGGAKNVTFRTSLTGLSVFLRNVIVIIFSRGETCCSLNTQGSSLHYKVRKYGFAPWNTDPHWQLRRVPKLPWLSDYTFFGFGCTISSIKLVNWTFWRRAEQSSWSSDQDFLHHRKCDLAIYLSCPLLAVLNATQAADHPHGSP